MSYRAALFAHRFRWPLLAAVISIYMVGPLLLMWLLPSACVLLGPEPQKEVTVPLPDVFGANEVAQTLYSPGSGLAGIVLRLAGQGAGNEATVFIETASEKESHTAVIPVEQEPASCLVEFRPLSDSQDRAYTVRLFGPEDAVGHRIVADAVPGDPYAEGVLYLNGQPVEADLAIRQCYRPSPLAATRDVWKQVFDRWWSPYGLVLNRMSQYKPHLMKGPYLLFLITASAVGVLLLFTAQLGGTRGSSRWLLRGLEKTMALSLVLVAYGVGTGMMRQLDFFPNPILAHRVDGTVSMPRRDGARVTHDLLLAWATGDATVTAAEDGYVDVRWFGLNNEARPVLWMHPPSSASYSLAVPPHATLEFAPAIHPEVWLPEYGDGTVFIVRINDGEREETVFYQHVDAKNVPQDRRWHDTQVDLGIYAGQQVTVTFATEPLDSNAWDWAGWATPALLAFEPSQAFSP